MPEQIINKISGKGFKFEIFKDNKPIARAYLYILSNDLHQRPFGFVEDVFVEEDYRGKGYGTEIMEALIRKARQQNCYKLVANSRLSRKKVHNFYKKLGFNRQGYEFRIDFSN